MILKVKDVIEEQYDLKVINYDKLKNIYKIVTDEGVFVLKIIRYERKHLNFILEAMNHLQRNEFKSVPRFVQTKEHKDYIEFGDCYAYLIPWIYSRLSNYDNPFDLRCVSKKLAELHNCSEGFIITEDMNPRIYWGRWIEIFTTRAEEILDFKKRIYQKVKKSNFDKLYLEMIEGEISRVNRVLEKLEKSNYIEYMNKEVMKLGFCHHDYAHHNILIDEKGQITVIDFDYCILDTHLHDLCSLMIRTMKDGKWDMNTTKIILDSYGQCKEIVKEDIPIMDAFIEFPQQFWQIGLQYYWEMQPWEEDFFIEKLMKYREDVKDREEFVEEFSYYKV